MSPLPVLRAELAVLGLFVRRLPGQVGWVVLMFVASAVLSALLGFFAVPVMLGGMLLGPVVAVAALAFLAAVSVAVQVAVHATMWRNADRKLLGGGSPTGGLPVAELMKATAFIAAVIAGAAALAAAALYALPWRLQNLALSEAASYLVVAVALAAAYLPLLLRLGLLLPLVAMDNTKVGPAWRLILRTTRGKTVPLAAALLFQMLAMVPLWAAYCLLAVPALDGATMSADDPGAAGAAALGWALAGMLVYAFQFALLSALQAGVVRHFFGYADTAGQPAAESMVVEDPPVGSSPPAGPTASPSSAPVAYFDPSALEDPGPVEYGTLPPVYAPAPTPPTAPPPAPSRPRPAEPQPQWEFADPPDDGDDPFDGLDGGGGNDGGGDSDPFAGLR